MNKCRVVVWSLPGGLYWRPGCVVLLPRNLSFVLHKGFKILKLLDLIKLILRLREVLGLFALQTQSGFMSAKSDD